MTLVISLSFASTGSNVVASLQAAPPARPRRIKCSVERLGRRALKTLSGAPAPPLPWPSEGLGAAHAEGLRSVTWHPEAPWPPQRYLIAPRGTGGKPGRAATWPDGKVTSLYCAYPRSYITDKYSIRFKIFDTVDFLAHV
uniref:Uncharacterized protein n=1 Tax=Oryza sativa subsp. japonica TaxID=39947 RepID=Q7XI90_ORYSJ|nr:hypothetical protein [Oryza sativa Japonica Group]BAD30492.1 hypothetical protein [Oryza sativa Japonica Group]